MLSKIEKYACFITLYKIFDKYHLVEISFFGNEYCFMSKRFLKKIGLNIKFLRKSRDFSQEMLAEKINKSRNYVGMIERAEVNTPILTLYQIAKALNAKISEIIN